MSHIFEDSRKGGLGLFLAGVVVGGTIMYFACDYFIGRKFGNYCIKTENGKARVENILRIDGDPKYLVNLRGGGIESLIEIKGFNLERNGNGFEAKAYGEEFVLRSGGSVERYSKRD